MILDLWNFFKNCIFYSFLDILICKISIKIYIITWQQYNLTQIERINNMIDLIIIEINY